MATADMLLPSRPCGDAIRLSQVNLPRSVFPHSRARQYRRFDCLLSSQYSSSSVSAPRLSLLSLSPETTVSAQSFLGLRNGASPRAETAAEAASCCPKVTPSSGSHVRREERVHQRICVRRAFSPLSCKPADDSLACSSPAVGSCSLSPSSCPACSPCPHSSPLASAPRPWPVYASPDVAGRSCASRGSSSEPQHAVVPVAAGVDAALDAERSACSLSSLLAGSAAVLRQSALSAAVECKTADSSKVPESKGSRESKERKGDKKREREDGDEKKGERNGDRGDHWSRGKGSGDGGDRRGGNGGRDGSRERDDEKERSDDKKKRKKESKRSRSRDESDNDSDDDTSRSRSRTRGQSSRRRHHRKDKRKPVEEGKRKGEHPRSKGRADRSTAESKESSDRRHSASNASVATHRSEGSEKSAERSDKKSSGRRHRHSSRHKRDRKHRHHSKKHRRSRSPSSDDGSSRSRSRPSSPSPLRRPKNTSDPTRNTENDPFPADLQGPCFLKVLPRRRDPPVVLGIDNRGVLNLAKAHGCKLKLSSVADLYPQTERRFLLIYGAEVGPCVAALQGWIDKTAELCEQKRVAELTFLVPHAAVSTVRIVDAAKNKKVAIEDLKKLGKAKVKISSRKNMKKANGRERLVTLNGPVQDVQAAAKCLAEALQGFRDLRDYMNIQYVEYSQERKRKRRPPSPLPTIPRVVIPEPSMPTGMVPGLQFQRALQGVDVQDELVKITNLRGILDTHCPQMHGPAYTKIVISDLVTTLLLGTTTQEPNHSCPLRLIEATFKVAARIMDPESPGILERILILSGEPQDVDKATMAVLEKVYAACIMAGQASQVAWRMCASNSAASLIIGTGGHRVKQLRTVSNTRIQINTRDNVPVVDRLERVITVTGSFESVVKATKAMLPFMHADSNHSQHIHQCYGTGRKAEMPDWVEAVIQRDGMDEDACSKPPLVDAREVSFGAGPCFLKLLIDNGLANALIGENSQAIQKLSDETKCVMKFADPDNIFPGCPGERILMMSGAGDALNLATIAVIEKCKEVHPNLSYDQMYGKIIVPQACCAAIVGHGGQRIREIRDATMTRVEISKKGLFTTERLVTIFGMPQGVHTALITICGIIQCDSAVGALLEMVYPPEAMEQQRKLEEERLSAHVIGAVMEGVNAVVSKVGGDESAQIALRKLQEMQRTAAMAAGDRAPEAYDFRGPLGPVDQTRRDTHPGGSAPDYSASISFIPASSGCSRGSASTVPGHAPFPFPQQSVPPPPMGGGGQLSVPGGGPPPSLADLTHEAHLPPPPSASSSGLSRQALRQRILDASLNRAKTAAEALRVGALDWGTNGLLDDGDLEEDPALAGLMDEKF
ncbi:hypothetical protein BESB_045770 [Besnoitia besnoiti]|uniref:K Homology domain-containing protein n=1 Tax=Besnoitia besnoiti TaxID=94643 RepID=A0A2A9MEH2_BESBE|nr:hypothetical protein BESB_045770 [Besnoitia besnoiti]PFH36385.1 hypothetical protein BESB_045770 [Besnoitia besnoiti]